MRTTIVGGAVLPHAPQFFTQPDTEDKDTVARVKQVAAEIGTKLSAPVLPIYVNAYLPPQPTPERCYAFGQAVARCVTAMGLRTVALASGGMSHFPGTDRYGNPALDWDQKVLARIAEGNLKSLAGYDEAELDETGNVELRCWACAAGMLGERKPDVVSMEPSWHHDYASLGWFESQVADHQVHYPSIKPELVALTSALHTLAHDANQRAEFLKSPDGYADKFNLAPDQRSALIKMDIPAMVAMGTHPLVPFLARLHLDCQGPKSRRPWKTPSGHSWSTAGQRRRPAPGGSRRRQLRSRRSATYWSSR